ncbi:MAG: hypothetical protein AUK24_01110 [Syntrophaceae bacterium CG2_30_49_12]|nr:MAG: hypothetical protein AUK24_01110 [Syntrophaceae bacterium CG2_30_49_12]
MTLKKFEKEGKTICLTRLKDIQKRGETNGDLMIFLHLLCLLHVHSVMSLSYPIMRVHTVELTRGGR